LLAALGVLCAYRFYDFWTTGFFVSDEYGYFFDAVHGAVYSDRWFVGWLNIVLFKALGITSVDAFSYLLPFYLFFWAAITLVVFYKLMKLLEFDEATTALSLLSSFILISFVLLSLGFLTEPVGLCMAMSAIYFLARFLKSRSAAALVGFPLMAGCFFGFAAGTREPYNAFLLAGGLIVLAIAVARRKDDIRTRRFGPQAVLTFSVVAFVVPALFFLLVPTQAYSQQVLPISGQIFQSVASNPLTTGVGTVSTTTITSTVTGAVNGTVTVTTTVKTTTSTVPFYREFVLTNTLLIFFGGLALGWGPICFALGLAGFLILMRRAARHRDVTAGFMLFTSLTALASYLIVSFIFAPDPNYFSFQNYSTVIRFSDTALPAYFIMAPMALAIISRRRKRMLGLAAITVLVLLLLVPVYETYAASNISYTASNPFQLGYRTDAVLLRGYFASLPANQTVDMIGFPYGWTFTPGVQDLRSVHVYWVAPNPVLPFVTLEDFTSLRWTNLYVFVTSPSLYAQDAPFVLQLLNSTAASSSTNAPLPFTVVSTHPVFQGPDFKLYQVQVEWK